LKFTAIIEDFFSCAVLDISISSFWGMINKSKMLSNTSCLVSFVQKSLIFTWKVMQKKEQLRHPGPLQCEGVPLLEEFKALAQNLFLKISSHLLVSRLLFLTK
jgi:hypothetical protein